MVYSRFYFAPIAEGLGDLLITLPALKALIETGVPTHLVLRSPKQAGVAPLIPRLAGWLKEPDFLALKLAAGLLWSMSLNVSAKISFHGI